MEEHDKAGHEKLREIVCLHHNTIIHLLQLLKEKQEKEVEFWDSLRKHLKEVKGKNGKS